MLRHMRIRLACLALPLLVTPVAHAVSSDLVDKVEQGLLCHSDWSTVYWNDYLNRNLKASIRDWGEARWWQSQGATLGGAPSTEIFVNLPDAKAYMIGALFSQELLQVKNSVETKLHVHFTQVNGIDGIRWITPEASVLVPVATPTPQTKWYCARWMLGNRP